MLIHFFSSNFPFFLFRISFRSVHDTDQKQIATSSHQPASYRAPLIIVSLYLPSEAKTLAPTDVKRDLRRPPSFCQKYQRNFGGVSNGGDGGGRNQCKCKINDKPDLMLRGIEITETSSTACISPPATVNQNPDSSDGIRGIANGDKLNDNGDECMACSACILEIERNNRTPSASSSITACLNETALHVSYTNYHMDAYGNLNQNLELSCDRSGNVGGGDGNDDDDDSPDVSLAQHSRPGTPDASRIIRITLNNKNNNTTTDYEDDDRRRNSCGISSRHDIDDKPNSTSCRSIKSAAM